MVCVNWVIGCQQPQKANVWFEIITFEIAYRKNFVTQIWGFGLETFENKCQIWNQHYGQYFLAENAEICKTKASKKSQIFKTFEVLGCFDWFWIVLDRFGWLQLVLIGFGFNKDRLFDTKRYWIIIWLLLFARF